jgi:hypothetical protein
LDFLQENVVLMPSLGALAPPSEGVRGDENPLGRASLAAILIAKSEGAVLYSDDLVLRAVAQNDWQVKGVWSQTVLRELLRSGALGEPDYHRAVSDLILNRYHFVSADEKDYYWLLLQEGGQVTPRFTTALRVLEGPDCSDHSAVKVVTEFLRVVWLEPHLRGTRPFILDACVAVLRTGRNLRVILSLLEARVRARFAYHPEALNEILGTLVLWAQEDDLLRTQRIVVKRDGAAALSVRGRRQLKAR